MAKWRKVSGETPWLDAVGRRLGGRYEVELTKPLKSFKFTNVPSPAANVMTGMTIGHWHVGIPALAISGKRERTTFICVSKCGVIAAYEPWQVCGGKLPLTCYGCRPGENAAPPPSRVLREPELSVIQQFWKEEELMATAFEEHSRLDSPKGHALWAETGRAVMQEIVNRTRYGAAFGWKVYVNKFQDMRDTRPKTHRVKLLAIHKGERKFEVFVQAAGSGAAFTVYLATGRTDVTFGDVAAEVQRAVGIIASLDTGENEPVVQPPPPANGKIVTSGTPAAAAAPIGPIDIAKLMKLHKGIETLMTVGKDVNELATLKTAARMKVEAANAVKGELHVKKLEAEAAELAAMTKNRACEERVTQCEMTLRNALAARDNCYADVRATSDAAKAAAGEYDPAAQAAAAAEKELDELEAMEADRLKQVGDAKGLSTLLEALSKIG